MASARTAGLTSAGKAVGIAWNATGDIPRLIEQRRGRMRLGWQRKTVTTYLTVPPRRAHLEIYSALAATRGLARGSIVRCDRLAAGLTCRALPLFLRSISGEVFHSPFLLPFPFPLPVISVASRVLPHHFPGVSLGSVLVLVLLYH
jgi:hypothetical protein